MTDPKFINIGEDEITNDPSEYRFCAEDITADSLKGKSLFIATPMYGGNCNVSYTRSIIEVSRIATAHGIPVQFYFIANESLITRARNYCAEMFLRSNATHMMFIDADVGFEAGYIFELLHACDHDKGRGIMGGLYAKKSIAWEKVALAVKSGFVKTPKDLAKIGGDLVYNPAPQVTRITMNRSFPVLELGTGFMMIDRKVLELYKEKRPDRRFTPDHIRDDVFNGDSKITAFFECYIDPVSNRYLSEDYAFCREVSELGVNIHVCPWMNLQHQGTYIFEGNLEKMLSLGVSSTASLEELAANDIGKEA